MAGCLRLGACVLLALILASPSAGQNQPKTALLERAGWDALAAGRPRAAAEAFEQALATDPRNARLHLGAGAAAVAEGRDSDARTSLERALQLDPASPRARVLLGRVLYRTGDLPGAISTYEVLAGETPGDTNVLETLERWRRELELHTRMQLEVGSHFTVSFEGPPEAGLAARVLDSIERASWRIGDSLGTYPHTVIPVVLYTTEQFRDITRPPAWAAGAFDGTIRIPIRGALDKPEELDRIVAHEFTHALIRTLASRGVPIWLDEGLAAALENTKGRAGGTDGTVSIAALPRSFAGLTGSEARIAYDASAEAVRRLLDEAGGPAIVNLLRDLGEGADFEKAFAHRMQRSFAEFLASLAAR